MKKFLKIIGTLLGVVVLILIGGFVFISARGIPSYDAEQVDYHLVSTTQSIERGKKLSMLLCVNCHKNQETGKLTGQLMVDAPKEFGVIYSANITADPTYGIGGWTDGELVYLLRTGIKKDGKYAPPWMPKLPQLADEDMNAIISFLRSDDPLVSATKVEDLKSEPSFLSKFLCTIAFKPLPMPSEAIQMPDTANKVDLGKYLAHNLDCYSCHSADFKTNNPLDPELSEGYFGGGNKPLDMEGRVMRTQNLTPDPKTGIGNWSEETFVNALKYGIKEGENALRYPMVPYVQLTDYEAGAIYAYLNTIPVIVNDVERSVYD